MCGHACVCQCTYVQICLGVHDHACVQMHAAARDYFTTYSHPRYFILLSSTSVQFLNYSTFIYAVYFTTMCIFTFIHVVGRLYPRIVRNDFNNIYIYPRHGCLT